MPRLVAAIAGSCPSSRLTAKSKQPPQGAGAVSLHDRGDASVPWAAESRPLSRRLLKGTLLESRGLELAFDAERDGWEAAAFHKVTRKTVDGSGPQPYTRRCSLLKTPALPHPVPALSSPSHAVLPPPPVSARALSRSPLPPVFAYPVCRRADPSARAILRGPAVDLHALAPLGSPHSLERSREPSFA